MRKVIPLMVMSGAALLAACGSTQKFNSASLEKLKQSQEPPTVQYLPTYKGIPDKVTPGATPWANQNGLPYVVPNAARILVPSQLEAAVKDTKNPYINGNYIGKNLTPNQRMAIYSAKMIDMATLALGASQYAAPGNVPANVLLLIRQAVSEIQATDGWIYGKATVPATDVSHTNPRSILGYTTTNWISGMTTAIPPMAHYPMVKEPIPVGATMWGVPLTPKTDSCFIQSIPPRKSGWYGVSATYSSPGSPTWQVYNQPFTTTICVRDEPGQLRHPWPMSGNTYGRLVP